MSSGSSLNNVVSSLVRASMGASVAPTVTDEELDRHVAELILKEAKSKAEKYAKEGIRAYLPQSSSAEGNVPRANKRFLNSLVKNVSDHNKVILQAQAEAAEQVKETRRREEMQDRRRRAEEAVEDRLGETVNMTNPDTTNALAEGVVAPDGRIGIVVGVEVPAVEAVAQGGAVEAHHGDIDQVERNEEEDRSSKRHSDRKRHPERPKHDDSDAEATRKSKGKGKHKVDDEDTDGQDQPPAFEPSDPTPATSRSKASSRSPSPAYGGSSDAAPSYSSKMDKYFSPTYDPRLDVEQPGVSKTGMLDGPQWDGWEGMLELMRVRAQDKEEKKRREREDKEKARFDRKRAKEKGGTSLSTSVTLDAGSDVGLMDMKYKKRGAVKEWDLAKETPT